MDRSSASVLLRVTLPVTLYDHIAALADAAGVEPGEVIRTLIKLDMEGKAPQLNPRVGDLIGQLYALVVKNDSAIAKTAPTVAHVKQLKNRKGTTLTPVQDEAILTMRDQGHTWSEIENYFNIARGTMFRAYRRAVKRRDGTSRSSTRR